MKKSILILILLMAPKLSFASQNEDSIKGQNAQNLCAVLKQMHALQEEQFMTNETVVDFSLENQSYIFSLITPAGKLSCSSSQQDTSFLKLDDKIVIQYDSQKSNVFSKWTIANLHIFKVRIIEGELAQQLCEKFTIFNNLEEKNKVNTNAQVLFGLEASTVFDLNATLSAGKVLDCGLRNAKPELHLYK